MRLPSKFELASDVLLLAWFLFPMAFSFAPYIPPDVGLNSKGWEGTVDYSWVFLAALALPNLFFLLMKYMQVKDVVGFLNWKGPWHKIMRGNLDRSTILENYITTLGAVVFLYPFLFAIAAGVKAVTPPSWIVWTLANMYVRGVKGMYMPFLKKLIMPLEQHDCWRLPEIKLFSAAVVLPLVYAIAIPGIGLTISKIFGGEKGEAPHLPERRPWSAVTGGKETVEAIHAATARWKAPGRPKPPVVTRGGEEEEKRKRERPFYIS